MAWSPSTPPTTTAGSTTHPFNRPAATNAPAATHNSSDGTNGIDAVGQHGERQHHVRPGAEGQHGVGVVEGLQHTVDRTETRVEEPWGPLVSDGRDCPLATRVPCMRRGDYVRPDAGPTRGVR